MNKVLFTSLLIIASYAPGAFGYCYSENGCKDSNETYEEGEKWIPKSHPCIVCYCYVARRYVLSCDVEVQMPKLSVKKSSLYGRITFKEPTVTQKSHEEVEISVSEAATKKCDPVRAPEFNSGTLTFENVAYKSVYYYYTGRESQCCSTGVRYTNVHPSCRVVQTGECTSKVVLKDDDTQPCMESMSMVG